MIIGQRIGFNSTIIRTLSSYAESNQNEFFLLSNFKVLFDHEDSNKICDILKKLAPIRLYLYGNEYSIKSEWSNPIISAETATMANEDNWCVLVNKEPIYEEIKWTILSLYSSEWQIEKVASINLDDLARNFGFHSALRQAHLTFDQREIDVANCLFDWYDSFMKENIIQAEVRATFQAIQFFLFVYYSPD